MGQNCLWNSEKHNVGDPYPHVHGDLQEETSWKKDLVWIRPQYFVQLISMLVPRDMSKKITNIVVLAVPEAVLSHNKGRSSLAVQYITCVAPLLSVQEAIFSHVEAQGADQLCNQADIINVDFFVRSEFEFW